MLQPQTSGSCCNLPHVVSLSPRLGLDTAEQAALWCAHPSRCALALLPHTQLPLQGYPCFAWTLRPWAGLPASVDALTPPRLWHCPCGHSSPLYFLSTAIPCLVALHPDAFLSLLVLWHPLCFGGLSLDCHPPPHSTAAAPPDGLLLKWCRRVGSPREIQSPPSCYVLLQCLRFAISPILPMSWIFSRGVVRYNL